MTETSGAPHDLPDVAGLVEAVREFLESDVLGATDGRVNLHVRMAARVLAMVERELELGPGQADAHRHRLDDLGFADDAELAAAIRAGALDGRWAEVLAAVTESVDAKLAVANPEY